MVYFSNLEFMARNLKRQGENRLEKKLPPPEDEDIAV
jgi:hypothetical protein